MSKRAIICVDDEKIILQSLKNELQELIYEGYIVETAESGVEALEVIGELLEAGYELPAVIIDYIMPGMKGDELLKKIHQISPATIKIMLSGQATIDGITSAINQANLFNYIEKPWKRENLRSVLNEAINKYYEVINKNRELEELQLQNQKLQSMAKEAFEQLKILKSTGKYDNVNILGTEFEEKLASLSSYNKPIASIKKHIDELVDIWDKSTSDTNNPVQNKKLQDKINELMNEIANIPEKR